MLKVPARSPFYEKYYFHDPSTKDGFLTVRGAGIVFPDPEYRFRHAEERVLFEYIVSGRGDVSADGTEYGVSKGDTVILPPGKNTVYGTDPRDPYTKLWFTVSGSFVERLFADKRGSVIVKSADTYVFFVKFLEELGKKKNDVRTLAHILLDILLCTEGNAPAERAEAGSAASRIRLFLDASAGGNVDLGALCAMEGISERTLVRKFGAEYGVSPSEYIRTLRLEKAKEWLLSTQKSVTEIARLLGFCDQSYFSSEFKKKNGVYPTEYRKNAGKSADAADGE